MGHKPCHRLKNPLSNQSDRDYKNLNECDALLVCIPIVVFFSSSILTKLLVLLSCCQSLTKPPITYAVFMSLLHLFESVSPLTTMKIAMMIATPLTQSNSGSPAGLSLPKSWKRSKARETTAVIDKRTYAPSR